MKAFLKVLYAVLAVGVIVILIDNKFFSGDNTGVDKSIVERIIGLFSDDSYDAFDGVAVIHKPEGQFCTYYLKSERGNILFPDSLDSKYKKDNMRVRINFDVVTKVQDDCHRGTFVKIKNIEKF